MFLYDLLFCTLDLYKYFYFELYFVVGLNQLSIAMHGSPLGKLIEMIMIIIMINKFFLKLHNIMTITLQLHTIIHLSTVR